MRPRKTRRLGRERLERLGAAGGGENREAAPREFEREAAADAGAGAGDPGRAVAGDGAIVALTPRLGAARRGAWASDRCSDCRA